MSNPFQTKVIRAWDYRQGDLTAFCKPFEVDQEQLEESLLALQKKFTYLAPVETVAVGDIVTMCCRSENVRFQKDSVTCSVGKNLYSRELEAQIPGMTVGESRELTVNGAAVSVQIRKAERNMLPDLTDDFLTEHFQQVHTMQALKDWYIGQQLEAHIKQCAEEAADFLQEQALANSRISVDEEERLQARAAGEKIVREMWEFNGLPLDQMTDAQAVENLGCPTPQAYIDWFADLSEQDVFCAALGYELLHEEGKAPTEESYREAVRKMTEEEGTPAEQLKDYTFASYARQVCAEHYRNTLEAYAYQMIKEKIS